jgi:OHCU decarboxylase
LRLIETLTIGLNRFNSLSSGDAEAELLKCCGARNWARRIAAQRPFANTDELLDKADSIWWSLDPANWLEAFRSHPKIGERKAAQPTSAEARTWSEQEQSGTRNAAPETIEALAIGNRDYEQKFGYIFIVCATGKSSEEMLTRLSERLGNDPERELRIAAEEQSRITQLRLKKLIDSFGHE